MVEYALYYKETLPLRDLNINYLNECIRFELNIELYRTPSQTQDEFDKFTDNIEMNLNLVVQNNPYLVVFSVILMRNRKIGMAVIKPILKGTY